MGEVQSSSSQEPKKILLYVGAPLSKSMHSLCTATPGAGIRTEHLHKVSSPLKVGRTEHVKRGRVSYFQQKDNIRHPRQAPRRNKYRDNTEEWSGVAFFDWTRATIEEARSLSENVND